MTPRLRPSLLLALAALALTARHGGAQTIQSPYRFIEERQAAGVVATYLLTDEGRFGFGPKSAFGVTGRYGLEVAGPVGLEARMTAAPTTRDVVSPARDEGDRVIEEAESTLLLTEVRLRLDLTGRRTWNGIQPYVFAGGGLGLDVQGAQSEDQLLEERDRFEFGNRFLGSFGTGLHWMVGRLAVQLDGSLLLYQLSTPSGFQAPERELGTVPDNEWVSATTVSLGLSLRF